MPVQKVLDFGDKCKAYVDYIAEIFGYDDASQANYHVSSGEMGRQVRAQIAQDVRQTSYNVAYYGLTGAVMVSDKVNTVATWGMLIPPLAPELAPVALATGAFSASDHYLLANTNQSQSALASTLLGPIGSKAAKARGLSSARQHSANALAGIGGAAACEAGCGD